MFMRLYLNECVEKLKTWDLRLKHESVILKTAMMSDDLDFVFSL